MKKATILFLVLIYTILLISFVLLILIIIELNKNGLYEKDSLVSDFNLSLIIVLPQILLQIIIYTYIKKNNIKLIN